MKIFYSNFFHVSLILILSFPNLCSTPTMENKLRNCVHSKFKNPKKHRPSTIKDVLWKSLKNYTPKTYRNFLVVIPSYNNKDWYKKNLDSVFMQDYPFYQVIYIDDFSPDGTSDLVENYIKLKNQEDRVILIKNRERMFALANYYAAIHACYDNDTIAVILDGDDWWANDHVLSLLNKVYDKFDIWMTYGQYEKYPSGKLGISRQVPAEVIKTNSFRSYKWVTSQQRTFYVWLFKLIKKEDLLYNGKFFPVSGDVGVMLPMLEMAGKRSMFIPDIIYIYNNATPLNNLKVNPGLSFSKSVTRKKPPYQVLEKRPM